MKNSETSSPRTDGEPAGGGIVLDIGTGDGRYVYRLARANPSRFYIGIDANAKPLEKISTKATRKPAKGGLANVLFVQAAAEDLPAELDGVADEVHVHFPWGSLLGAVLTGEETVLGNLRRVCAPGCLVEIVAGIDDVRDRSEIERLGIPSFSSPEEYLEKTLAPKYRAAGFDVLEHGVLPASDWSNLETSWARKLQGNPRRRAVYLILRAS